MAVLNIKLLGGFGLSYAGKPVTAVNTQKARGLLAYLCMHPNQSFSRVALATLFWPDQSAEKSSHSLRQALSVLRKKVPNGKLIIQADRFQITFATSNRCLLDVDDFESLAHNASRLDDALAIYNGPLLNGFFIDDSVEFETWMLARREQLQNKALALLEQAAEEGLNQNNYGRAKKYVQQIIELDPLHELAYQSLMLIDARQGDYNRAIASFQKLKTVLKEELGVEPIESTFALLEKIQAAKKEQTTNNLPNLTDGFVGRESEIEKSHKLLAQPNTRLVTIIGPGGVGKSTLALHVAQQSKQHYLNGTFFVSLGALNDHRLIAREIAKVVRFKAPHGQDFEPQLIRFLANREMLLVLDNFEHLLKGGTLIASILQETADISILATSREPLNLHGEQRFRLAGLPYPVEERSSFEDVRHLASHQLFVARAQRVDPDFLVEPEIKEISKICRLLEGMPLGIELAAAQLENQSLAELSSEISKNFNALEKDWVDRPGRHRSLKAAFLHSWEQLDAQLKSMLASLSVFRGGFDLTAADQIAGASRQTLSRLINKSLLRKASEAGRYEMHPVVQQYAAEEVDLTTLKDAQQNHATYFLNLLKQAHTQGGFGADILEETIRQLGLELGNIRFAWQHAVCENNLDDLADALTGMSKLYAGQSWFREGANLFNWTINQLEATYTQNQSARQTLFWGHLIGYTAGMSLYLSEVQQAKTLAERSIKILESLSAPDELGYAWNMFGISQIYSGQFPAAIEALEKSLECYRQTANIGQMLGPLVNLGSVYQRVGNYEKGLDALKEGLDVSQTIQDRRGAAHLLNNIGGILFSMGRLNEAVDYFERCVTLCGEMGYLMVEASALLNLAEIELRREPANFEQIRSWLESGLQISEKIEDRQKIARGHKLTADYLLAIDQPNEAWDALIEGLTIVWEVKAYPILFEVLIGIANHTLKTGRLDLAKSTLAVINQHTGAPQHIKQQALDLQEKHALTLLEPLKLEKLIEQILS